MPAIPVILKAIPALLGILWQLLGMAKNAKTKNPNKTKAQFIVDSHEVFKKIKNAKKKNQKQAALRKLGKHLLDL